MKPNAVPSLNLPIRQNVAAPSVSAQKRGLRLEKRTERLAKARVAAESTELAESEELIAIAGLTNTEELAETEALAPYFDHVGNGNIDDQTCIHLEIEGAEIDEHDKVPTNKRDASVQVDITQIEDSIFSKIIKNDSALNVWTGIPTFEKLKIITDCVETSYTRLNYTLLKLPELSIQQQVTLCFIKLKSNLSFACISSLFKVSAGACSRAFTNVIPLIRVALQSVVYFPSVEEIHANLPSCLKNDISIVRGVLDCIEINIEIPKCTRCRKSTYSGSIQSDTTKFLYCITPGGLISYVSKGYSGNSSDKFMFNNENIINQFDSGDTIIVERGFLIEEETKAKGIKLIRPTPFQSNQLHFNDANVITNTKVAVLKLHVERAIEKMNMFKIMTTTVEYHLLPHIDDIVFIIASIVNLSCPLLKQIKF